MQRLEWLAREVVTRWERGNLAEAVRALDRHRQEIAEDRERYRDLIERAIDLYADDDIEIDADRCLHLREPGRSVRNGLPLGGQA